MKETHLDMASPDELPPESDLATPPPQTPFILDLSTIPGNNLRRLPEVTVVGLESDGEFYSRIFRQLQIRPDKHQDFHNGVIRVIRNKHHAQVKRGSDASRKTLTELLLRAFGYIIWKVDSEWLIDRSNLEEGETRLSYLKADKGRAEHHRYVIRTTLENGDC